MVRRDEVEVLRRRGVDFLAMAEKAIAEKKYDLACFMLEQAAQLYLKAALLKLVGEYSRTLSLRCLVWELAEASRNDELWRFGEERRTVLSSLEDVYIMARYFPKEYSEMDAVEFLGVVRELFRLVDGVAGFLA
jgi:HEPN domain-containing protein